MRFNRLNLNKFSNLFYVLLYRAMQLQRSHFKISSLLFVILCISFLALYYNNNIEMKFIITKIDVVEPSENNEEFVIKQNYAVSEEGVKIILFWNKYSSKTWRKWQTMVDQYGWGK